jgi:hypothetical protein
MAAHARDLACTLALALLACAASAETWHVDPRNQTGTETGSPQAPFDQLSDALAAASADDTILLATGDYPGPVRIEGRALTLRGGFAGATAGEYAGGSGGNFTDRDPVSLPSTINGPADNAAVLLVNAGATTLDGLRIRGGTGAHEDAFRTQGGGVYIDGGAPTITGCLIEDNDARSTEQESFGGGIFTTGADTVVADSTIRNNRGGRGAGIAVSGGAVRIHRSIIEDNVGDGDHGGGIYAFSPDIEIADCIIRRNEIGRDLGYGWGGGVTIFNPGARALLLRNRIHANHAPTRGPGVFIDEGASATLEHCLVYANTAEPDAGVGGVFVDPSWDDIASHVTLRHCTVFGHQTAEPTVGGNGLFLSPNTTAVVENSIIWGNDGFSIAVSDPGSLTISYSTVEEAHAGAGVLTVDPLLADPASGDFHLRSAHGRWDPSAGEWVLDDATSPAIDAGDPAAPFALEPQGNGKRVNQGAHGNTADASRTTNPDRAGFGVMVR